MKIRTSFVTNSSSSSFIVAFDKVPQSAEEVRRVLFGEEEYVCSYDLKVGTNVVAQAVFEDICAQSKNDWDKVFDAMISGWYEYDGYVVPYDTCKHFIANANRTPGDYENYNGCLEDVYKHNEKVLKKHLEDLKKRRFAGKNVFVFDYADDTDFGSVMEHGGIFSAVDHIKVSNH